MHRSQPVATSQDLVKLPRVCTGWAFDSSPHRQKRAHNWHTRVVELSIYAGFEGVPLISGFGGRLATGIGSPFAVDRR